MKTMLTTNKIQFQNGISKENKIGYYIKFNKNDKILGDFIDYLSFYTSWNFVQLTRLLSSDNGPSVYIGRLSVDRSENIKGMFRAWVSTVYMGYSVKVCQLAEMKIGSQIVLKIDIYGKGLKLLREDVDLYKSFKIFCRDWLELGEDLTICRIDYTVDCMKLNFRKYNSLRCRCSGVYYKDGLTKTKYFGKRGHDSAMFIRYYDKKEEISNRNTSYLYPEYQFLPEVMRYELQVNSKGFSKKERIIKLDDLHSLICLGYHIGFNKASHEKKKDESIYEEVCKRINELKNINDKESLDKIRIYLDGIYRKGGMACPVLCETSEIEKHFQRI